MNTASNHHDARGFTLLELVAALFVVSLGLFGVIQLLHFGVANTHALNEAKLATRAVQNEIETLRALPYSALRNVEGGPFVSEPAELAPMVNVKPRLTIQDYDEGAPPLKHVTATVSWTGEHGRRIEKTLTTLIADKGGRHGE